MFALFRRQAPEPAEIAVAHEGATFRIQLRRKSEARRITLRVSGATGEIRLTCPQKTPFKTLEAFAAAHAGWIAARVAKLPDRVPLAAGAEIPLRGVPHLIRQGPGLRGPTRAAVGEDGAASLTVCGEAAHLPRRLIEFLKAAARRDLAAAVARHTATLGIPARRIGIRDTRSRWGSCSSSGNLNFSWRLILAPPFVLDYLAAHEVAHLREMNHSRRFWRLVAELCPRTEEAESWLKRNGHSLHRYG